MTILLLISNHSSELDQGNVKALFAVVKDALEKAAKNIGGED
jgi:hypothetical protein